MSAVSPLALPPTLTADPRAVAAARDAEQVARGFEGMFTSLLVQQMRQSLEPDTLFGSDHGDVLGGMFDTYLGEHLARAGALGIGRLVRQHLPQAQARATYERNRAPQPTR